MQTRKIAIVTCKKAESYGESSEGKVLRAFLQEKALEASLQIWDDNQVDWSEFDFIVVRSPWDYIDKIEAFKAWLDKLEQLGSHVLNPINMMRWNSDKIYLREMQEAGVNMIPTVWLEQNSPFKPEEIFQQLGVDQIVVKPRVSGGAKDTHAFSKEDKTKISKVKKLLKQKPCMAQPFMKEIQTQGEWSFLFFNGKYSHTVLKTPRSGEFKVHFSEQISEPPKNLLDTAQFIVNRFAKDCLYTRVDGLEVNGNFMLMELELIEPYLFFEISKGSIERYYEALSTLMQLDKSKAE